MIDYETLIAHLRECAKYEKADNTFSEAANAIEAILARDRWIPADERLPEPTWDRVLVYTDEHQIMTLPAMKVGNGYVTHWRELPEPPVKIGRMNK